jgi:hypothetical protein
MRLFSRNDDELPEERAVGRLQHKAYRDAASNARKLRDDEHVVHDMLNEAVIAAEADVPWWRR